MSSLQRRFDAYSAMVVFTAALALAALYAIFVVAPVEQQMGVVQKIFYFHVPCAYAMYIGFVVCGVASAHYLIKRDNRSDALSVAASEVGLLFCLAVLISGPLWARKSWGVFWTWDPRLTTTFLAGLIFAAFVVLRASAQAGEAEKRFASVLAVLGVVDLPVIHYSVRQWRGTHPAVITGKGGGLAPEMVPALALGFALFTAVVVLLIWQRYQSARIAYSLNELRWELDREQA